MTIGIYCIHNTVDGKRYIGKSKDVDRRLAEHKRSLRKERTKDVNRHLYNAVQAHGIEVFSFYLLEELNEFSEEGLADLELYYMDLYNTCDKEHGYNLRRDSSTLTVVHKDTRDLLSELNKGEGNPNYGNRWTPEMKKSMSDIAKQRHIAGVYGDAWKAKVSETSKALWQDEDKKYAMARKVAAVKSLLRFYEYDKVSGDLLKVWESMGEILQQHPDYHRIAIYNVCNGYKKSYRGSVWKSETKVTKAEYDLLGHRNQSEA
jgi:group I intron endonuclease